MDVEPSDIKVLVIDASAHIRRLVSTLLGALAIRDVIEARSPRQAEAMMSLAPDLVIIDWTGDGTEALLFIHRIRRGEFGARNVPILALATTTHHAVLEQALEAGIDDVIVKPLSAFDLINRSAALLEEARCADWFVDAKAAQ